jgi:hypothetical protein
MSASKIRSFRCTDEVWNAAGLKARSEHVSRSTVIAELLAKWAGVQEAPVKGSH